MCDAFNTLQEIIDVESRKKNIIEGIEGDIDKFRVKNKRIYKKDDKLDRGGEQLKRRKYEYLIILFNQLVNNTT